MNTPRKTLLVGSLILGLGAFTTASAYRTTYVRGGVHRSGVVAVRPAPVYAYRPYHRRHVYVGPEAVYAYRPYHHHKTIIVRHRPW